ncbi:MAG: helix-turn-helix domain-containing protein [Geminicoccaceae bacterium]
MTGSELKALRSRLWGVSQAGLARMTGYAKNTIERAEAGSRRVPPDLVERMIVELERTATELRAARRLDDAA